MYRFGDGVEKSCVKTVDLPVMIGSKRHVLGVDVVESDIPLLISKPAMT